jgi:L-iditol 2-dehydrogenase
MKALVLQEYKKFSLDDVPAPEIGAEDVLIAVKACGICGSDVHGMDGSTGRRRPPIIMGHEAAGVIADVGANVKSWKNGQRVTFDSTLYCGKCEFCRRGEINLCSDRRVLGVSCEDYRQNGAFAEFVAVPQRVLHPLPDSLPFEQAALVEPFAIALHAIRRAAPNPSDTAVVIGCGMIGLALIQTLRATGCQKIIATDVAPDKLERAKNAGATDAIHAAQQPLDKILLLTKSAGADVVFEAVGLSATFDLAVRSARKGGRVVLVGNVAPKVELALQIAVTRELTLLGSCASAGEYPACLEMLGRGAIDARPLLSAVAPLKDGPMWFERLYNKEPGLLKIVLTP